MGTQMNTLEICAGAGGQSLGLEEAGFGHAAAVEIDADACNTLRSNRPHWQVLEKDIAEISGRDFRGVELISGGVPCPPFSIAGKRLGPNDERDLFPDAIRLVREARPAAVMLENVKGFAEAKWDGYRHSLLETLESLGYVADWRIVNAADHAVPQLRPRFFLVAISQRYAAGFQWPEPADARVTVAETLRPFLEQWRGFSAWVPKADVIGPTIVGGSKKHGGPDLGPTRARAEWLKLGIDGRGIANAAPSQEDPRDLVPRLTLEMVAALQGFPPDWRFSGGKTAAYRQIGNALPPPVAKSIGQRISSALVGLPTSELSVAV